jgi:hypothetical protein
MHAASAIFQGLHIGSSGAYEHPLNTVKAHCSMQPQLEAAPMPWKHSCCPTFMHAFPDRGATHLLADGFTAQYWGRYP